MTTQKLREIAESGPKEVTSKFNSSYNATAQVKHFVDCASYNKLAKALLVAADVIDGMSELLESMLNGECNQYIEVQVLDALAQAQSKLETLNEGEKK